jgi:hypothetical protein
MLIIIYNCRIFLYYEDVSFDNRFCGFFFRKHELQMELKETERKAYKRLHWRGVRTRRVVYPLELDLFPSYENWLP